MIIIDKAVWQIDGGVPEKLVVNHFKTVFLWLEKHDMLSDEGKEDLKGVLTDEEYQLLTDNKELKVKWFFFGD